MSTEAPNRSISDSAKDFLPEAEEVLEEIGARLADLADMAENGATDPDMLNAVFRGAHSLKGLSGMFGFSTVAEVAHNTENLLDSLRMGRVTMSTDVINLLYASVELLSTLLRAISEGAIDLHSEEVASHSSLVAAALLPPEMKNGSDSGMASLSIPDYILSALTDYEEHRLKESLSRGRLIYIAHFSFQLESFDTGLSEATALIKGCGELISTLPSVSQNIETNIDFELLFASDVAMDGIKALLDDKAVSICCANSGNTKDSAVFAEEPKTPQQPLLAPAPTSAGPALEISYSGQQQDEPLSARSMSATVRVEIGKLDELMNIVGELVLAHSSIASIANRMRMEGFSRMGIELSKAAKGLERRLSDLQNGVMDIRMIPVGQLYDKMARIVRKISREQGKKIELKMYGADTELDKLIVEDIADPLMHIIRNAIDHGIEAPEARLEKGKPERGIVKLSSYQKGNHVIIEVEDDGAGIDAVRIRNKAVSKGLISDTAVMSDREALELIFLPGFSTADQISEVSGRGVGMDVVRNNIAAVSGMVDIETWPGRGSRFTIILPITLAIIKALIISTAGRIYALPITSVVESLLLKEDDVRTVERREVIDLRSTTLPLLRLDRFLGIERVGTPIDQYVVVTGAAEKRLGIVVDDLLGRQDIVIKSLGEALKSIRGISGAADLGDQRTILVLDAASIINEMTRATGG